MTAPRQTLYLIDGSSNLYRSYYAIRGLTNSSGLATNAVYGFTTTLRKLIKDQKPDAMAVAFDVGSSTFRKELFADYKKDRKAMPDDLSVQIPFVREMLNGFGIPVIGIPDYEADDLIGSLARMSRDRGYNVVIATSDKDFYQLVGDGISLYHTSRDVLYDEAGVREVFGLAPSQVLDVMAIWGDAIDGIPGVPGIGEKGAKALITEFGSLDNLYANLDKVQKVAQRKKLEEHRDKAYLSRDLATIKCDLDVEIDFDQLALRPPDREKLHDLFSRLEFLSLMQEFMPSEEEKEVTARSYRAATSAADVAAFASAELIAIHLEPETADASDAPFAVVLSRAEGESLVVPVSDAMGGNAEMRVALRRLLRSKPNIVTHDSKAMLRRLRAAGWGAEPPADDTMLESYVLNPGLQSHSLESAVHDRLKRNVASRKEVEKAAPAASVSSPWLEYLGEKSEMIFSLHQHLHRELGADDALGKIYRTIELPLVPVLASMEERGIRIDVGLLASMSATMGAQIAELETKIYAEAGEEFNINSPTQLGTILFDKLQYPVLKKTQKTKSSSTGVEVLKELAGYGYAVPKLILEHRELHKLKSTYVDALPLLVAADGRVHTSFNQAVAATGRLSSSDPNLQNIPIRTPQGREIRRAFIAGEGRMLIAADYSQIELRVLAHITGDPDLIETFRRGADIHRATAAKIFNVHEALVTPDQRRAMKTINFGVLYGMSAFRLSQELGISNSEAKEFIESYFSRYPRISGYLEQTLVDARASGKVTTMFGRVRYIPEINNRSWTVRGNAERMATNAPIQGTAADLLKLAMIALDKRLADEAPDAGMLLTVHDEIVIEAAGAEVERVAAIVKETMETIHPLAVPLAVEAHWGRSWYDAKE